MEDARRRTSAAILIRQTSQWSTARRTILSLVESGATVTLFFLGYPPMTVAYTMLEDLGVECYADVPQMNMNDLPIEKIAAMLKQCDLVIPL